MTWAGPAGWSGERASWTRLPLAGLARPDFGGVAETRELSLRVGTPRPGQRACQSFIVIRSPRYALPRMF